MSPLHGFSCDFVGEPSDAYHGFPRHDVLDLYMNLDKTSET
jgi:hypothetical protein